MAAVEDPAPHDPDTIPDGRPDKLWDSTPVAREAFHYLSIRVLHVHQTCVIPLDLHVCVMTSRPEAPVRADFRRYNATPIRLELPSEYRAHCQSSRRRNGLARESHPR